MFNFFKNKNKKGTGLIYQEPNDPRDTYTSDYIDEFGDDGATYFGYPKSKYKKIEVEDQKSTPSCVGQTLGKDKDLREGGDFSKRYIYVLTDKYYESSNKGGLSPQNACKMMKDIGTVEEKHCEDQNRLRDEDYYDVEKIAGVDHYQNTGYSFVPRYDIPALKAAFKKHKTLLLAVYKGRFNRSGELTAGGFSNHAILALGIEEMEDGKHKIYFVNSWGDDWGDDGFGYFIHEDVVEAGLNFYFMATANVPITVIEENKNLYPTIRYGSRGEAVAKAQRILGITSDGIFGRITKRYVVFFQIRKGLVPDGIVGKNTWAALLAE